MSLVEAWIHALTRELQNHKGKVAIGFAAATFITVVVGCFWPKKFEASALVYADEQNIIQPLLSGSAEVTKPDLDQAGIARDRIVSNTVMSQALIDAGLIKPDEDDSKRNNMIISTRGGVQVTDAGRGHIRIAYRSSDPARSYQLASALTGAFIKDTSRKKRQESSDAYQFINSQVTTYKDQLQAAEDKLKNFKSQNPQTGGPGRGDQIRSEEDRLTLELQIARAQRDELQRQISKESQFVNRKFKSDGLRERLSQAQSALDILRLSYNETYPDIVSLKQQIEDLKKSISAAENAGPSDDQPGGMNPVYAKLRADLSAAEVNARTLELRLGANKKLLEQEQGYSKIGAEYEAQLAELTRDYTVTKQLYEDMLERKEKARLSVALDVEGQGVTYRIKEPPVYPSSPIGLRFMHFFLLAPFAGLVIPIALLIAFVQLDPRVRFVDKLENILPETVPVMAIIPHMTTPAELRLQRAQWLRFAAFTVAVLVFYASFGLIRLLGVI